MHCRWLWFLAWTRIAQEDYHSTTSFLVRWTEWWFSQLLSAEVNHIQWCKHSTPQSCQCRYDANDYRRLQQTYALQTILPISITAKITQMHKMIRRKQTSTLVTFTFLSVHLYCWLVLTSPNGTWQHLPSNNYAALCAKIPIWWTYWPVLGSGLTWDNY